MYGNFLRNGHSHREAGPLSPVSPGAVTITVFVTFVTMTAYLARLLIHGLVGTHHSRARPQEHRTLRQGLPQAHRLGALGALVISSMSPIVAHR